MRKYLPYLLIIFFISVTAFIFIFRSEPTNFNSLTIEGKFSISIPEYLSKTDKIDSSALLQYQNEKGQIFLLVYEETDSVKESLQDFFKKFSDDFVSKIEHGTLIKYYPEKINGCNALVGNVRGSVNDTKVYYRIAVIESASKYFEIIFGSGYDNQSMYDEDMNIIIQSIRLQ